MIRKPRNRIDTDSCGKCSREDADSAEAALRLMNRREFLRKTGISIGVGLTSGSVWAQKREASGGSVPVAAPRPRIGINLYGPADWNTELPFVDVFRMSRPWISQRKGAAWGKGPPLQLDAQGWVKRLEPGCGAETLMCTIEGGHYPAGTYTVLFDGLGDLKFSGAASVVSEQPGRIRIRVDPRRGPIFMQITRTDPGNYVRNIRVLMPGFEQTFRENPWHPIFLRRWQGMACLRFMDWMKTNNSRIAHWAERPTTGDATFMSRGVPLELMIDLSNRLGAAPWFCMPHLADDQYVQGFAEMVRDRLDPGLKVYIEYSNEVWNSMFKQSRWAGEEGRKLGFAEKPWEAAWRFTAFRSVQIFKIWERVFGGADRLVRVLPSQAASAYVSERILEFRDAWRHADALAIAPYITMNVPARGKGLTAAEVAGWTVDQVLDHVEKQALPRAIGWIRKQKAVADKYGLLLTAYEGGQHLVGVRGGENNEALTHLFHRANAHPRMGRIYEQYLKAWKEAGGDLFCHFSSVGKWSKWGSWGLLQYYDDSPEASPKFMAVMRWVRRLGRKVSF